MKMKSPFNLSRVPRVLPRVGRWLPALAITAVLGGVASAPASALHANAPEARVAGIMRYWAELEQECQINKRVPCPPHVPAPPHWTPPLFGFFDRDVERYMHAM